MQAMEETKSAYLAGIIDGEGSVVIRKTAQKLHPTWTPQYTLMVCVSNTFKSVIDLLKETFGGGVCRFDKEGINGYYKWQIYGTSAEKCLKMVLPYMLIKRMQAELGLVFCKTRDMYKGRGNKNSPELMLFRDQVKEAISRLNHLAAAENKRPNILIEEYDAMFRTLEKSRESARLTANHN